MSNHLLPLQNAFPEKRRQYHVGLHDALSEALWSIHKINRRLAESVSKEASKLLKDADHVLCADMSEAMAQVESDPETSALLALLSDSSLQLTELRGRIPRKR